MNNILDFKNILTKEIEFAIINSNDKSDKKVFKTIVLTQEILDKIRKFESDLFRKVNSKGKLNFDGIDLTELMENSNKKETQNKILNQFLNKIDMAELLSQDTNQEKEVEDFYWKEIIGEDVKKEVEEYIALKIKENVPSIDSTILKNEVETRMKILINYFIEDVNKSLEESKKLNTPS